MLFMFKWICCLWCVYDCLWYVGCVYVLVCYVYVLMYACVYENYLVECLCCSCNTPYIHILIFLYSKVLGELNQHNQQGF